MPRPGCAHLPLHGDSGGGSLLETAFQGMDECSSTGGGDGVFTRSLSREVAIRTRLSSWHAVARARAFPFDNLESYLCRAGYLPRLVL